MVHNGIEYGDMQLICEAYWILKNALGLANDELYEVFDDWNHGELDSYLIEITRDIFSVRDPETGGYLVDKIMDTAGAKGTGKWMSQLALDLGVPSTLVTEAVYARCLSAMRDARIRASSKLAGPSGKYAGDRKQFIEQVRQALYASKIVSYAQGYVQMQAAAVEYKWPLDFGSIALLWRGGCIIRAVFLQRIKEAFDADPKLENLLLAPYFKEAMAKAQDCLAKRDRHGRPAGHSHAGLLGRLGLLRRLSQRPLAGQSACRPSAIILGPTPISGSIAPACFTATGCGCERSRSSDCLPSGPPVKLRDKSCFDLAGCGTVNLSGALNQNPEPSVQTRSV